MTRLFSIATLSAACALSFSHLALADDGPAPSHISYEPSDPKLVFCRAPTATHVSYDTVEKHIVLTIESKFGAAGANGTSLSEGECGKVNAIPSQTRYHHSYSASISVDIASYATIYLTTMQTCLSSPGMMLVFDDSFDHPAAPIHCIPWKGKPARAVRAIRE